MGGIQQLIFNFAFRNANTEDETFAAKKKHMKEMKNRKKARA